MCIFVAIPTENGFIFGSQRDDLKSRKTSSQVILDKKRDAYYVRDEQSGGTWFAMHSDGVYAVLLNGISAVDDGSQLFKSRGELVLRSMEIYSREKDIFMTLDIIKKIQLSNYKSFYLSMGAMVNGKLVHTLLQRDALQQQILYSIPSQGSILLVAPTLYKPQVYKNGLQEIDSIIDKVDIDNFLEKRLYNVDNNECIVKEGVVTKSRTLVAYHQDTHSIEYVYKDFS